MHNRLKMVAAMAEVAAAEARAAKVSADEYPVGSRIAWEKGRGICVGTIEVSSFDHHGPHFLVLNEMTSKKYWIDFYNVVRADGQKAIDHYFDSCAAAAEAA